jgi:hypothetical protein
MAQQELFMYGCHMFQPHEAIIRGVIISVNIVKLLHNFSQGTMDKENKYGKIVVMGKHYSVSETQEKTEL